MSDEARPYPKSSQGMRVPRTVELCEARIAQLESAVRLARDWFKDEEDVAMSDAMAEALNPIGSLHDYLHGDEGAEW